MATTSPTATRDLHQWGYLKESVYICLGGFTHWTRLFIWKQINRIF